jgi:hypothetical protein
MRPFAILLAAAACVPFAAHVRAQVPVRLGSAQSVQQLPSFKPGDAVDFYTFGKWVPCTVSSHLDAGAYSVRCGSVELRAKPDPRELRPHVVPPPGVELAFGVESAPASAALGESIGARYGTRDPRICNRRPDHFSPPEAKEVFICDSEHEFGGSLYLVSEVSLEVSKPRAFNPAIDARKSGMDRDQPVLDISATYNNFQCSPLPASHLDYPNMRNCNESRTTSAIGGCFKNIAGEWHCQLSDFSSATVATAKSVSPPTTVE